MVNHGNVKKFKGRTFTPGKGGGVGVDACVMKFLKLPKLGTDLTVRV